jgi:hypothetical protein
MSGDWAVLHLDGDPAPGDPGQVRTLATRLLSDADRAERNTVRLRTISAADGELRMDGDYAPKFRQTLGELPAELAKLSHAYRGCGQALSAYAGTLEQAQGQAATALRQGRDADGSYQGALRQVQSLLPPDRHAAATGLNPSTLDAGTADLDPGLRAEIHAAAARGRAAEADRDRARRLAQDAAQLRGDAESRCARTIRSALAGIRNKQWYEKAWDVVSKPFRSWDDFVTLCRNVALIAGTVALFVSGPIGLALVAIALIAGAVVFANTLNRYQHGQAGLADVGWDALGMIPGARGVANLRRLGAAAFGLSRTVRQGLAGTRSVRQLFSIRRVAGGGPRLLMRRDVAHHVSKLAEIDLSGVKLVLDRSKRGVFGYTPPGGEKIILYSDAFRNAEQLVKTIAHERVHVEQIRRTGRYFRGEQERLRWEREAEGVEEAAWTTYLRNVV